MAITTRGWGSQGGVITTQGFGCFPLVVIDAPKVRTRILSPELQTLINQIRISTRCKTSTSALVAQVTQRNSLLEESESALAACGQRLRVLIKNTRIYQKQRRTP